MKHKISLLCLLFVAVISANAQNTNTVSPPVPEEARKYFVMGTTLFKDARSADDFTLAIGKFKQSTDLAPQWPEARFNLATAREAAGDYAGALADLKIYQQFKLPDDEARKIQDKIYILEAKQEMAVNNKELAVKKAAEERAAVEAKARESSPEAVAAKKQTGYDDWLDKLNGARFDHVFQITPFSWVGRSGPFVTQRKAVFTIKGKTIVYQYYDLAADGQLLHTYPAEGPHRIEGRQFTIGNGGTAVISADGVSIKAGDYVYEREDP